jgi:hypothetical protein
VDFLSQYEGKEIHVSNMGVYEMSVLVSPQNDCVSLTKTEFLKLFREIAVA